MQLLLTCYKTHQPIPPASGRNLLKIAHLSLAFYVIHKLNDSFFPAVKTVLIAVIYMIYGLQNAVKERIELYR